MELNLRGKTAAVTGASRGIGRAILTELLNEGVNVIDLSRTEGIDLMTKQGMEKAKKIVRNADILINNVGGMGKSKPEEWWECMKKNYGTMAELTQEYLKTKRSWGRVITISSMYGKEKGLSPWFSAAKSAQIAYMKVLAGRHKGTTFNTICPSHIDVGKPFPDNPKIIGKPKDVASLVVFLCSDRASHINGACIAVDGGASHSF